MFSFIYYHIRYRFNLLLLLLFFNDLENAFRKKNRDLITEIVEERLKIIF